FFQAEDGIRDSSVTGVQTCALPISPSRQPPRASWEPSAPYSGRSARRRSRRSEERRVGEECRCRWSPDHSKKEIECKCRSACSQRLERVQTIRRTIIVTH